VAIWRNTALLTPPVDSRQAVVKRQRPLRSDDYEDSRPTAQIVSHDDVMG